MRVFTGLSRRQFVASAGTLLGVAFLPACGPSRESRELGRRLVRVLEPHDRWRLVGKSWSILHHE